MKNNAKINRSFYKLIILTVSLALVSYAWFVSSSDGGAGNMDVTTFTFNEIEVSLDNGNTWNTSGNLMIPTDFVFKNEITGNGVNFYRAEYKSEDGNPIGFVPAVANQDYFEFNLMFRSEKDATMFLESRSYVRPSCGTDYEDLIGSSVLRISSGGNYSRDLIAGAVRVAFIDNDFSGGVFTPKNEASLVWAPNKNYEMVYNNGSYTPSLNSINSQEYSYFEFNGTGYVPTVIENLKDQINAQVQTNSSGGDPKVTEIVNNEVKQITVRVWIEGNDREAITELKGGYFLMSFSFVGITKDENSNVPFVSVNGNNILGYNNGMEHSYNNGLTWVKYADNTNPTFVPGTKVLVRFSETDEYFSSSAQILNF